MSPMRPPYGDPRASARHRDRNRPNISIRRLYYTERWARLRSQVLVDAVYECAVCHTIQAQLDVDHIRPHRNDPTGFFDRENLQALCASCHTRKTIRGE
jgi:5-methylcytosine-specific restriction enzyme A